VLRVLWTCCLGLQTQNISAALGAEVPSVLPPHTTPRSWTTLTSNPIRPGGVKRGSDRTPEDAE
jgi:hypothetical protein